MLVVQLHLHLALLRVELIDNVAHPGVDDGLSVARGHRELACEGKALLVVSSELPELIGLCRRILVMREGRLAGEVPRADFSEAALLEIMAGVAAA
jgi:ABC-type sugar transport system ATPase subunit